MQIKNNYQLEWEIVSRYNIPVDRGMGVFNGDMGRILEIKSGGFRYRCKIPFKVSHPRLPFLIGVNT